MGQLNPQSIPGRKHPDTGLLRQTHVNLPWFCLPYRRPKVSQNGYSGFQLGNNVLSIGYRQVIKRMACLQKDYVNNQQFTAIAKAQAIKIAAIRNIGKGMLTSVKEHTVGFYRVDMPNRGGKGDITHRIGLAFL